MESQQRRPKNYYVDYRNNRQNRFGPRGGGNSRFRDTPEISVGNKGFLLTSVDEVKSYLEMRNILESYYEIMYKAENNEQEAEEKKKKELSTEDELENELKQLRITKPFKQVKTHCRNSVFINIMKDFAHVDPVAIVDRFFDELLEKREIRTTNTFKVLPIIDTFRNNASSAKESVTSILANSFNEPGAKKFFIEFHTRGNYKLESDDKQKIIETVAQTISDLRPDWSVDRETADYIVSLVSLKNVCCIAVLKDYFKRYKYNLIEISKTIDPDIADSDPKEKSETDANI